MFASSASLHHRSFRLGRKNTPFSISVTIEEQRLRAGSIVCNDTNVTSNPRSSVVADSEPSLMVWRQPIVDHCSQRPPYTFHHLLHLVCTETSSPRARLELATKPGRQADDQTQALPDRCFGRGMELHRLPRFRKNLSITELFQRPTHSTPIPGGGSAPVARATHDCGVFHILHIQSIATPSRFISSSLQAI
jgi:hypothetical protein